MYHILIMLFVLTFSSYNVIMQLIIPQFKEKRQMKIVFYNAASLELPAGKRDAVGFFPSKAEDWNSLAEQYPQHEFVLVTSLPSSYLIDGAQAGEKPKLADKIKYVFIDDEHNSPDDIARLIENQSPEIAVAISTPGMPIDWNFLKDAVVGEKLREAGIKVVAHTVLSAISFYDKWRSQIALRSFGFDYAKGIYINISQFRIEQSIPNCKNNIYKEYVLHRVRQFNYPVIIKDTTGAGSSGIQVANDFEQAKGIITSDKITSDLIVEEMIQGESFGTEIHGVVGHYHVLPPISISTNENGISVPNKDSVKFGPVTADKYNIPQLQESLRFLAESFYFAGSAQVDLVFRDGKWYIIEINPRWSGMTAVTAAMEGRNPLDIYAESALIGEKDYSEWENLKYVLFFKVSATDDETLEKLAERKHVKSIMATTYTDVVIGGFDTKEDMLKELDEINAEFPGIISETAIKNAHQLAANG